MMASLVIRINKGKILLELLFGDVALDGAGKKLFRINPKNLAISVVAKNFPVGYSLIGSYPPVGFAMAMAISPKGDIYLPTMDQGLIKLQKIK
jgi:hypothetical protein